MKKTAIIILTLTLFILIMTGCEERYKTDQTYNSDQQIYQTITINPVKSLGYITSRLDESLKIDRLVVEERDRELDFQLVPASGDPEEILNQYNYAHQRNTELLKKLLPDNSDDPLIQAATGREKVILDTLSNTPKTLETIMVSSVTIYGSQGSINNFKQRMEESPQNGNYSPTKETPCPNNASCKALPDKSIIISYKQPIALSDAIETLPVGYGISRITAIENNHSFTVAYSELLLDANQLIAEYQEARNENLEELIRIQADILDRRSAEEMADTEYLAAIKAELDELMLIKSTFLTPDLNIHNLHAKER